MIQPDIPYNESERLRALKNYHIVDTLSEQSYDDITFLASLICQTPISLISLIDEKRQWFKSKLGLEVNSTSREISFCGHAINEPDEIFVVTDASKDKRFIDNPLVTGDPNIAFYAGVPLVNDEGMALGTLCVIDRSPRKLNDSQTKALQALGRQLLNLLELRKTSAELKMSNQKLDHQNKGLKDFAMIAAHDLKSPLAHMVSISELLKNLYGASFDDDGLFLIDNLNKSSRKLSIMVDGILKYSVDTTAILKNKEDINLKFLITEISELLDLKISEEISIEMEDNLEIFSSKTALQQIFMNIISNAIKYNDKEKLRIEVGGYKDVNVIRLKVSDNGPGIKKADQNKIFGLFATSTNLNKEGNTGTGIGLATVKSLVIQLGGKIELISIKEKGTTFEMTFPI